MAEKEVQTKTYEISGIKNHPYFDEFIDPVSGIKSYVLNTHCGDIERISIT